MKISVYWQRPQNFTQSVFTCPTLQSEAFKEDSQMSGSFSHSSLLHTLQRKKI